MPRRPARARRPASIVGPLELPRHESGTAERAASAEGLLGHAALDLMQLG